MMLHKTCLVAAFLTCSWGCGQTIAQDVVEVEPQSVEELRKAVRELTARVEALEKLLFKAQSNGVAPEFEKSIRQIPQDTNNEATPSGKPVFNNRFWLNGVDAGMMIDSFEHGIRWRNSVPSDRKLGLPKIVPLKVDSPLELEGPTIFRNSPRR